MDWRSGIEVIRPRCCRCPRAHSAFFAVPAAQRFQPALSPCDATLGVTALFPVCRCGPVGVWLVLLCTALETLQGLRFPLLDLVRVQALFPAILAELCLGKGSSFDDGGKLGFS